MRPHTTARRFVLIDSIRGLAALAVGCFHFYNQLIEHTPDAPLWGATVRSLMTHGDLGVYVFFVLSGFVIACSLHRVQINRSVVARFALRRSLRLDPSYWSVIFVTWLLLVVVQSRGLATGQQPPSGTDVLANMFYLDNLFGFRSIVKVGWTLCLEIQFYLVFVLAGWLVATLGAARKAPMLRAIVFWPLAAGSMLLFCGVVTLDVPGLFLPTWFMYFLGVVTWWSLSGDVSKAWFGIAMAACLAVALWTANPAAWVAAATGGGIYLAGITGTFDTLLQGNLFRYFGRISYSFYLLHPLVGSNFIRAVQRLFLQGQPLNPWLAALIFAAALVVSVAASHILYRMIELPSHRLSRRIRWSGAAEVPLDVATAAPAIAAPVIAAPQGAIVGAASAPDAAGQGYLSQCAAFCLRERRWLVYMLALVIVWAVELFAVQAATLVYPNETSASFAFWAPKIRLALDLLFIAVLVMLLGRKSLSIAMLASFFAYLGLVTYHHYFLRPLSLSTLTSNWREALGLKSFAVDLFPKGAVLVLTCALVAKLVVLARVPTVKFPRRAVHAAALVLALTYGGLYAVANHMDPLNAIRTTRGVGRLGEIRGYMGAWFAEWYYLHDGRMLSAAVARRERNYDRLTPIEADIPIHDKLVILQAESFDNHVLDFRVDGQEVTPFLNRLRKESMFYRVRAVHTNGSSDADFAALNAVIGSEHVNTYTIPGYPYQNTTPQLLTRAGFDVASFHGNSGEFYNRRGPFKQMGFGESYFREEMENEYGLKADRWGIRDNDVLALATQKLRSATRPTCHFIITLTTHVPYTMLSPGEYQIFPRPADVVERYLNNMRYLDNCLRDYIASLGKGTTVVIYADHPTEEGNHDFSPDREGAREYIPCLIYDTDRDLSKLQQTRGQAVATDGSLNLVDVINYVRHQVVRANAARVLAPSGPAVPIE
jgi:peptidoglycan/LPS O-acetylase OafA/YrhL